MKTRKRNNKLLILINCIVSILFLLPVTKLDLYEENYSTLSLTTRGYLYVLILGFIIGLLFWYELNAYKESNYNILIFLSMLIGVIVPHHVPYNFQGNLHLICAYIGFMGLVITTLIGCNIKKYKDIYLLFIFAAILIYLKFGMVNTLSEIVVMIGSIYTNLIKVLKKKI